MVPTKLVYSSAEADNPFRIRLSAHLSALTRQGLLVEWHEQLIAPGSAILEERRRACQAADILLLLLSADYFASGAFDDSEMQLALERQRRGQLLIMPILLRPCDWQATIVASLQVLPRNGEAITTWEEQDAALLSIAQEIRQRIILRRAPAVPLSVLQRNNRERLLKRVRACWIEGMLEKSLHHAVWVDLHLQEQPGALENPWRLVVQELNQEPRPLPPGTSITQVFDQADGELLILGEPGSGKTTLLLYLVRTLLDRAEADERRRIPVVFNLSSWGRQRLPLEQWLVQELRIRYQVSPQFGQEWIEADQIFPLLDGLDEVAESAREACVQAIISYAQRLPEPTPLVITCRNEAYQALSIQLSLQYAVLLLPFTDEQIDVYLSSVSGPLDVLRRVLSEDKDLFELARRPLMLSVFTLAYQGTAPVPAPALAPSSAHTYPQAIFSYYVKHMLTRRGQLQQGTEEQVYRWLTYLATQLRQQQQTILTLEYLQPVWLPERYRGWYRWSLALVYALTFGLIFGPVFGLSFALVYGLIYRMIARLVFGLIFGLVVGLMGGLIGGLVFGVTFKEYQAIQPAEDAAWSWTASKKGLTLGVVGGLAVGTAAGLVGLLIAGPAGGLLVGLTVALLIGLVGGLVGGLSPTQLSERDTLRPNEGIWRSGKRGLRFVLFAVIIFGLAGGFLVGVFASSLVNLAYGLLFGLILGAGGGLIFGLAFGLVGGRTGIAAFLQHFTLRFFLWRLNLLPWRLVPFLNEAAERLLLYKVGGSYIFVHRLLRDALAMRKNDEA